VATSAALLSHLTGGGAVPGWLWVVVPWTLSLAVCTALAGRRLSLWRTAVSVALSQLLFHGLFVLGAPRAPRASGVGVAGTAPAERGIAHGPHGAYPLPTSSTGPSAHLADLVGADATMWLSHGVAAAVTVAALVSGERTLLRLRELAGWTAARLRPCLPAPADLALPLAVVRVAAPDWFTGSFPARPEVSPSRRRGPPLARAI
jgi:hypothetical protein